MGLLMTVVGGVLVFSGARRRRPSELALLAIGTAAVLAGIETASVVKRRSAPVYLADAAAQLALIGLWVFRRGHLPWRRVKQPIGFRFSPCDATLPERLRRRDAHAS
jgi:hypothetical protein